jgi:hypothetical protein
MQPAKVGAVGEATYGGTRGIVYEHNETGKKNVNPKDCTRNQIAKLLNIRWMNFQSPVSRGHSKLNYIHSSCKDIVDQDSFPTTQSCLISRNLTL